MAKYVCNICGYVYDEDKGSANQNIKPHTLWKDLPNDWTCPLCGADKNSFHQK